MSWGACLGGIPVAVAIGNLELWLRADTGVTLVSGAVSNWTDLSGHGRDASQAVAGNRPTVTSNSQNGQPGLNFNGATSNRFLAGSLVGVANITTLVAVSKMSTASQSGGIIDVTSAGGLTNTGSLLVQNATVREYRFGGSLAANVVSYAFSSLAAQMHLGRYTSQAGSSPQIFEKNVSKDANSSGIGQPTLTQYRIGRLFQNVFPFAGDILEVRAYSKALSVTEIDITANELSARYAL